jgi:hypothetical protein
VARAPLIRPTDAPPGAHQTDAGPPTPSPAPDALPVPEPRSDVPRHVAIIMDGNRLWAPGRGASDL